jgi:sugar phosphate isomerase/epimerase
MTSTPGPRLSTSTWSLHRALGLTYPDTPGQETPHQPQPTYGSGEIALLDVPERVAGLGIHTLEICHFHFPSTDPAYLAELRDALASAGVELFSLLIDAGDISHPEHHARDVAWTARWVETAGALGARCARVSAGKAPPDTASLARSAAGLRQLLPVASDAGVRLMTENWHRLLSRPAEVLSLLDRLEAGVGLCVDFGNWGGPTKYDDLAAIMPRAESCHAKAHFPAPGLMDKEDFRHCLALTRAAGFRGPYTLIYDGPGDDEWQAIQMERDELLRPA